MTRIRNGRRAGISRVSPGNRTPRTRPHNPKVAGSNPAPATKPLASAMRLGRLPCCAVLLPAFLPGRSSVASSSKTRAASAGRGKLPAVTSDGPQGPVYWCDQRPFDTVGWCDAVPRLHSRPLVHCGGRGRCRATAKVASISAEGRSPTAIEVQSARRRRSLSLTHRRLTPIVSS
jgi:hypothetical protein